MDEGLDELSIRQVRSGDAVPLVEFYNGLSDHSRRTFRPLGWTTTVEACEDILRDNQPESKRKYDLVAVHGAQIVGWSFLWDLDSDRPTFGLGIADDYRGRGLGGTLMDRVMETTHRRGLCQVFLTVVQDNVIAWKMYERRGFVRYGEFVGEDGLAYFCMVASVTCSSDPT